MGLNLFFNYNNYKGEVVGEKSATISYAATLNESFQWVNSISGSIGGKNISNGGGKVTFSNLSEDNNKDYVTIDGSITYYYLGADGVDHQKTYTDSIDVYLYPGKFSMGAKSGIDYPNSSDSIIANVLDSEIINDEWIPHFQAAYRWYNQKDVSYSPANITYDPEKNTTGMKVKSGEPIYAEWFNNCMKGMEEFDKTVDYVEKDDLITAELINQMNFSSKS